jgi:hypothetical protein
MITADLRISLQAVQLLALFPSVISRWPSTLLKILQISSISVRNLSFLQCC